LPTAALTFYEGEISIRSPDGAARPYERFSVTINPDGSRTLKAVTVSPNGTLVRDVQQSVSRDWRPLHGSSRIFLGGRAQGSISKWVTAEGIHSVLVVDGDYSHEIFPAPARFSIGFHPIADEAWKMALVDATREGRSALVTHTCSTTWNGRTMEHGRTVTSEVAYLGMEARAIGNVPAACRAFLWFTPFGKELRVWTYTDDFVFAGLLVAKGDNAGTEYVVSSLRQTAWP
jgi:hypothetical protein